MKLTSRIAIAVAVVLMVSSVAAAQEWQYPVIKDYGPALSLPNAAVQPDTTLEYKILFDIGSDKTEGSEGYNFQLAHVARLINIFATAGVMPDRMKLVAVVHSAATPIILTNEQYKATYKKDNPNLKLITELKQAGVVLYVCGQSLGDFKYKNEWVNPDITIALSAQVVIPTYELKGYAYMP
jgi:intracellular sulfur oxidation DsrE/DsrF family protein